MLTTDEIEEAERRKQSERLDRLRHRSQAPLRRWAREHGLTIVAFSIFILCVIGQTVAGWREFNAQQLEHGEQALPLASYVANGHFIEALFENWESEFLQMGAFVVLTAILREKGSPESKPLAGEQPVDEDPRHARRRRDLPWPVRRGGLALRLYEQSLSIALFSLFIFSFAMHAWGGAMEYNDEQAAHGGSPVSVLGYLATARFWFESLQNWQSEFLSVGVLFVLTVYLRQRGSPQSKPVAAPHALTGEE